MSGVSQRKELAALSVSASVHQHTKQTDCQASLSILNYAFSAKSKHVAVLSICSKMSEQEGDARTSSTGLQCAAIKFHRLHPLRMDLSRCSACVLSV